MPPVTPPATERVRKSRDYAAVPSLSAYVPLEQTAIAATLDGLELGGPWIATRTHRW